VSDVALPAADYRSLREAFQRGDHREVLASGEWTVAALDADVHQRGYLPAAMLMVGTSLAQIEHYREATAWLEQGLVRLPGTPSAREMTGGHWFHRTLAELYLLLGRWARADAYLEWLSLPQQPLESRLSAARGQATLAGVRGDFDRAHWLVNTAADLARRARSNRLAAFVEADRVVVLVRQGRVGEAVQSADEITPRLGAAARGPQQAVANAVAVDVYTHLARRLVREDDPMTAERYLLEAVVPSTESRRTYCAAQLELARGVVWRAEGEIARAAAPLRDALRQFEALGAEPAIAVARAEVAHLARQQGLDESAGALFARAAAELRALGHGVELADLHRSAGRAPR
jgi:ATP/maltotriose-dependent transcriptional regulator MalT